ncbi:DHH family phosphoesterase [Orenia marismortui]|uniref:Phosphoesterase RecJ-like protein n=1 Tax=Orenia marismortui TaxID=46469 RepID=A0A4V3GYE4_9FIRM|nr:bifunctional oligoribonuclease/PAP phosphatase NrnA [Orenia marismortui]TDX51880.1 phosphoesterase RecJ-like protein [Orenia marismortui]
MKNNKLVEITNLISQKQRFLITSHVNPDGDNLGSVIALKLVLEQLGKETVVVIDDEIPSCFSFLHSIDEIIRYEDGLDIDFDMCFTLDCSDLDRIAKVKNIIKSKAIINIDHHGDNPYFGEYNLVKNTAATAEIIYQLIDALEEAKLNKDIAAALATGLITDTGSFRYSNTTSKTHKIMAELLNYDVDTAEISKKVFDTHSYQSLVLRGKVLQNLQIDDSKKIAWVKVSQDLLSEVGATMEDTEGIVNYPRSLAGVEIAILFKETEEEIIRVSLRSNSYFPVDKLAHKFGGGGHPRAAGCSIDANLNEAIEEVVNAAKKELKQVR